MPSDKKLMLKCSKCKEMKDSSLFYQHPSIKPDGIRKKCNECRKIYRKLFHKENLAQERKKKNDWGLKNRDKINAYAREKRKNNKRRFKSYCLKKSFGIGMDDYDLLSKNQNGLCKLCGFPEKSKHHKGTTKNLSVDHCHKTGKIRGLLCWQCNSGIGKLKDNPEILRRAAEYIEKEGKI